MITVKTKISFKKYLRLLMGLTYSKPMMKVILAVDLLMITWIVLSNFNVTGIPPVTFFQYTTVALISFAQPAVIYNTIRRNYQSSGHLKENLKIELTRQLIKLWGESFYTELTWARTYKIQELKGWFLIYQNNLSAILIPKSSVTKKEITDLKEFLQSILNANPRLHKNSGDMLKND